MGSTNEYYLHGIYLPAGTWISSLQDTTPKAAVQHITEYSPSAVVPSFRGGYGARPEVSFTTPQIKTILDTCGMAGADLSGGNVDLYYKRATNLGTREAIADLDHLRIRCVRSMLVWDRISARQDQLATISCRLVPTYDGTNAPLTPAGGVAVPAEIKTADFFTMGSVAINTTNVDGALEWDLNLNPTYKEQASEGEPYLSYFGVARHDPVLTVTPEDLGYWATIDVTGLTLTALTAYLRKLDADGVGPLSDATAEHIKFTAADNPCGLATLDDTSGGVDDTGNVPIRCGLRISDVTSAHPLGVSTTSAIT